MKRIIVTLLALCGFLSHGHCELPTAPDAIVQNIEIQTGCLGDIPVYNVEYMVLNIGEEPITEYCIELWNEDYYQCFDSDLFGSYEIPPGEGQVFTTQFFEFTGSPGGFFVVSVDGVNDEIITGNNNTTVYYPEEWEVCPIECVADTIVIIEYENVYITDTLLITEYENVYIYDTITQYINLYDTLYIDNFIFDTTYVEVIVDNYIYFTDTITEYILEQIYIDCETGLECTDEPIGFDCESTTLYVPNTFTPNNDGVNDVWKIVYESTCWKQIDFTIYNRWGDVVFRGADDEFWDGSLNGGSYYVADGVYTYTLVGRREESLEYIQKSGMITVFR
jgi:gliding motility-associated-like protein